MVYLNRLTRFDAFQGVSAADWTRFMAIDQEKATQIEAAFADLEAQQVTIAAVQSALDSKNTIFRATSAPTATAVGDLWLDSDDGDKPYRWDGSSWVAVQDIGAAYARLGINSDGTIKDDKVLTASVQAGAILTTPGVSNTSSTTITSGSYTWQDCDDVTFTATGVEVTVRCDFNIEVIDNCKYKYRLRYSGSTLGREVGPVTVSTGDQPGGSITRRFTPSAGSVTVTLQAACNDANDIVVHDPVFDLTQNVNL